MIANKHTELRIYSNLNSLLENALDEKEYQRKIKNNTFEYIREYIDEKQYDKGIYDIFEELSTEYQKHSWNIADRIKDKILEEKAETNYLDPNVYTEEFIETLTEELTDKVLESYFKELNNAINVYEYKNKVNSLRKKEKKNIIENNKEDIRFLINARINKAFEFYLIKSNGNAKLVIDNFSFVQEIIDDVFDDVLRSIQESIDENITRSDIESMFTKQLKAFIKEKKALITPTEYSQQQVDQATQNIDIKIPKSIAAFGISSILKDITK